VKHPVYIKDVRWSVTTKEFHSRMQLAKLLVAKHLEPYVEEILGDHQCSLCRSQCKTDQTFSLRNILEVLRIQCVYSLVIHTL
jgi:hypothetical protein